SGEDSTKQFLKMDVALEKQIRDLEFKIGKMKFEKKNVDREVKKLEKLKSGRASHGRQDAAPTK
ncbi:MAG: hypothetical protein FWE31_05520, partial [Firmicutes bacterium]|nr:hypothetical protein [Bacillota bacterium]